MNKFTLKNVVLSCVLAMLVSAPALAAKKPVWKVEGTADTINTPESAYYDPVGKHIFVSNVVGNPGQKDGQGWISQLDESGKLLKGKWVEGLDAPKGLRSKGTDLWVTNIDEMVRIDIPSAEIKERVKIEGAKFLNDEAIADDGTVYVSDMAASAIYAVKDGKATLFVKGEEFESPNGLLLEGDKLYVAGWGKHMSPDFSTKTLGNVYAIDLKTKKKALVTKKPLGHLDGLERDADGNFLVSDWMAGKVFRVTPKGAAKEILSGFKHAADIGYIPATKQILVPDMGASTVSAW